MDIWQKNLAFLKSKSPTVHQSLISEKLISDELEYLPTEDNFLICSTNYRLYMHSVYSQDREEQMLLSKIPTDTRILVIFGFGNGKALEKIRASFHYLKQVIVVDPNPEPLLTYLKYHNFESFCKSFGKISFIINRPLNEAENLLQQVIPRNEKIAVVAQVAYRTIYADYYETLLEKTRTLVRMSAVNIVTEEKNRNRWLTNVWRNLKHHSLDVSAFSNVFREKPAILVSAGPSLNKNIHLLEQAKSRALIVAVGSAITVLDSRGIVPHFRIAIDGNPLNNELFGTIDTAACPLIYSNRLHYEVLQNYQAPIVQMTLQDVEFLERYIFSHSTLKSMSVRSGFSVANTAMDLLIKLGCSKIILVGQDLCYTDGRLHANGSWREHVRVEDETTIDGLEDIFGNQVYSSAPFLGMKSLFESLIEHTQGVNFINATEGGLLIKGAPNKTLAAVLDEDCTEEYSFVDDIKRVFADDLGNMPKRKEIINGAVEDVRAMVSELLERSKRALSKLDKISLMIDQNIRMKLIIEQLKAVNSLSDKQAKNRFFQEVVHPTFSAKFNIRGNMLAGKKNGERDFLLNEVHIVKNNLAEIHQYLQLTDQLINEYQGQAELGSELMS